LARKNTVRLQAERKVTETSVRKSATSNKASEKAEASASKSSTRKSSTKASTKQASEKAECAEFNPDLSWTPLTSTQRKGNLKAVQKEGGAIGIDLEGASHMGGTQFLCNYAKEPVGDYELLIESMKSMNAPAKKVTRAHEARAGCSADVAKMIVSANPNQIQVIAYVPKALQDKLKPADWLEEVMAWYGGDVKATGDEICVGTVDHLSGYGMGYEILVRHHSTDILQRLNLMAQADHVHNEDDEIFGDDHLPGMSEERKRTINLARKKTVTKLHSGHEFIY